MILLALLGIFLFTVEFSSVHPELTLGFGEKEIEKKQTEKFLASFWAKEIDKKEEITQKFWNHEFEEHIALKHFLWDLSLDREIGTKLANIQLRFRHLRLRLRGQLRDLSFELSDDDFLLSALVNHVEVEFRDLHRHQLCLRALHLSIHSFLDDLQTDDLDIPSFQNLLHVMLDSFDHGKFLELVHVDFVLHNFMLDMSFDGLIQDSFDSDDELAIEHLKISLQNLVFANFLVKDLQLTLLSDILQTLVTFEFVLRSFVPDRNFADIIFKDFWEKELVKQIEMQKWLEKLEKYWEYTRTILDLQLRASCKVRHQFSLENQNENGKENHNENENENENQNENENANENEKENEKNNELQKNFENELQTNFQNDTEKNFNITAS